MSSPGKGKGKGKFGKGEKGGNKGRENHSGKGYGEYNSEKFPHFEGECRTCGKHGYKAADCWHKQPKPQGKGKGKAKSKVPEVSESEYSKNVEETWTLVSSLRSLSSSVNTIKTVGMRR